MRKERRKAGKKKGNEIFFDKYKTNYLSYIFSLNQVHINSLSLE